MWVAARVRGPEPAEPRVGCVQMDAQSRTIRLHELQEGTGAGQVQMDKFMDYGFDNVFGSEASQDDVYNNLGPAMVIKAAKQGIHSKYITH